MTKDNMTVSKLLGLSEARSRKSPELKKLVSTVKTKIEIRIPVPWVLIEEKVLEKLADLLDLKVMDICVAGWKKYHELQGFADPNKCPPTETFSLPLIEHEIISEHHPALEVHIGGVLLERVVFDLSISLKLEGICLIVRAGRIMEISAGKLQGKAELKWEGLTLLEGVSDSLEVPGTIPLGEGVIIPAPS